MSARSVALLQLRGRVVHGVVLATLGALASQGSGVAGLVAGGAVGLAAAGYLGSLGFELAGLLDVSRDDGDALLTSGERIHASSLERIGRASLLEGALLTSAAGPVAVAVALSSETVFGAVGAALALFLGSFELLLWVGSRQAAKSRAAFFALRARRPQDVIAAFEGQDLRPAPRWNDALLLAEALVMSGAVERGLGVVGPHVGQPAVALRDAQWRLEEDRSLARAVLAQAPVGTRLDRLRREELAALLAVYEGRGAEVVDQLPALTATLAGLPREYGDLLRISVAAAANQCGRTEDAAALLASLERPLASHAAQRFAWPTVWRWIDPEGAVPLPPGLGRVAAPVGDAFAPPAVDPPASPWLRPRLEGVQPVPSLPVGVHRSPVRRVFALLAAVSSLVLVAPMVVVTPALLVLGDDPGVVGLMVTLAGVVTAVVALGLAEIYREWLRSRPVPPTEPTVSYEDGGVMTLAAFRRLGAPALVERVVFCTLVAATLVGSFGLAGVVALPLVGFLWNSMRPYARGRALTLAALDGDDAGAAALGATWLRAWAVVPRTRAAVEVHLALGCARRGDAAGAAAAASHAASIPEAQWCRTWLTADRVDASALERLLADDAFGWWRVSALAVRALADGRRVDDAAVTGVAQALRNRFGELLWVLLAMDRGREDGRALLAERRVDVTRYAWVGAVWPALATRYAGLL